MNLDENLYRACVGILLLNDNGELFVGQRLNGGEWQLPQGGIDNGEESLQAAHRELFEETSVNSVELIGLWDQWQFYDLPVDILENVSWKNKYIGQKQKWFLFKFIGNLDEINISTLHPEFESYAFWSPQKVLDEIVPFKKEVYQRVLNHFGLI